MGWGRGDGDRKPYISLMVAETRSKLYILEKSIKEIQHIEKRTVLIQYCADATKALDSIEFHLKR